MTTNEVERKKQKKIDTNHWMCKIQRVVFGIDAPNYYMGYCPFFWMTWVAVVCAPVAIPGRFIFQIVYKLVHCADDKLGTAICNMKHNSLQRQRAIPLQPTNDDLLSIHHHMVVFGKKFNKKILLYLLYNFTSDFCYTELEVDRMALWFEQHPDWVNTHLPIAREEEEKAKERAQQAIDRKNRLRKITNIVPICGVALFKVLIPVVAVAVAIFFMICVYKIVVWLTVVTSLISLMILIGVAFVYVFVKTVISFVNVVIMDKCHIRNKPFWLTEVFVTIGKGVASVYIFLAETVSMSYKQECPLIIWGEETGKIERRTKE